METLVKSMKKLKRWQNSLPLCLVAFVVLFHAFLLLPELTQLSPDLNDNVFHYSLCVSMLEEINAGGNAIDHWVPYWSLGFPVFHHYQHIPHLIVVTLYNLLYKQVPLFVIFRLFNYLLLVLYPLVLYYSLRKMNFSSFCSAGAALFSLVLSNSNGYGLELGSFIWRGSGIFSQLWAMFLLPLALSSIYVTVKENRDYFLSVLFLFLLANSQLMFGFMAILTSFLFVFIDFNLENLWQRSKRLLFVLMMFFVAISYLLVPLIIDSPYHAHSTYDFLEKWDSYGWRYVTTQFINGNILDGGRLPIVTFLAVIGFFFAMTRRAFRYKWAAVGFIMWFLLYFGRATWGRLFDLIPMSSALHLHRIVTIVHFFSVILAAIGLTVIFQILRKRFKLFVVTALLFVFVMPVFWDRYNYMRHNTKLLIANKQAFDNEAADFENMVSYIKRLPPGRVYPGRRANWGKDFKIGQTAVLFLLSTRAIPALSFLPFSWALPGDFSANFNEWDRAQCNLFNIKYILADHKQSVPDFAEHKKSIGRFRLYEVETTGYFDLVESPLAIYADKNSIWNLMLIWLRSSWPNKNQFISIFFDRKFHPEYDFSLLLKDRWEYWLLSPDSKSGSQIKKSKQMPVNIFAAKTMLASIKTDRELLGNIISEKVENNKFSTKVKVDKNCILLFKMTYHPGWHAYVDGREVSTVILSPGLIGVQLEKGEHEIEFVYRAQWWKSVLLVLGILALAGLFWRERRRQ